MEKMDNLLHTYRFASVEVKLIWLRLMAEISKNSTFGKKNNKEAHIELPYS